MKFIELVIDDCKVFILLDNIRGLALEQNLDEDALCDVRLTITFNDGGSEAIEFEKGCGAHQALMEFLNEYTPVHIGSTEWHLP